MKHIPIMNLAFIILTGCYSINPTAASRSIASKQPLQFSLYAEYVDPRLCMKKDTITCFNCTLYYGTSLESMSPLWTIIGNKDTTDDTVTLQAPFGVNDRQKNYKMTDTKAIPYGVITNTCTQSLNEGNPVVVETPAGFN